jgi:phosphoglucomutase / phosphopentomutase
MNQELEQKVNEWLSFDKVYKFCVLCQIFLLRIKLFFIKNSKTKAEIENLLNEKNYTQLSSRLCNRMEFGTAGLRSRMGAGYSMMNDLTIIQTGQGFLHYLKNFFGLKLNKQGVIIGYDARHSSKRFAELTANIFLRDNIPVYLFKQIVPTPFVVY